LTHPEIRLIGLTGIPEVGPGDDIAKMILDAAIGQKTPILDGDIIVVTQKVVSKAEGRTVSLHNVNPSPFAIEFALRWDKDPRHVEVILQESRRIVRMDRGVLICETHHGFVCANAGVDQSNIPGVEQLCLLPIDPDASARTLKKAIHHRSGNDVAVIISDTFGRPWRVGSTDVAIGIAGMIPLDDLRGQADPHGYILRAALSAVADEIAGATDLVREKISGIPVALVRGMQFLRGEGNIQALIRERDGDLFR